MFERTKILVILVIITRAQGQLKLKADVNPSWSRIAGEAYVTCTIQADKSSTKIDVVWVQRFEGEKDLAKGNGEDKEYEIGRNDLIDSKYNGWNKYEVVKNKYDRNTMQRIYKLKISDLKTTDSGQIGCRLVDHHIVVFKPLVVIANPERTYLKSSNVEHSETSIYHGTEKVSLHEGDRRYLACVINNTHPIPTVSFFLGPKDISDRFEKSIKLTRRLSPNPQKSQSFVSELFYDVSLSATNLEITHDFDKKKLSCEVKYQGEDSLLYAKNTSISINLHGYKPKFFCKGGELEKINGRNVQHYQSIMHHSPFTLKCTVLGLPVVDKVTVQWKKAGGREMVMNERETKGNHRLDVKDDIEDENAKEMTFKITHLFLQHFRTYTFVATNSFGKTYHSININQLKVAALESSAQEFKHKMITPITILFMTMTSYFGSY